MGGCRRAGPGVSAKKLPMFPSWVGGVGVRYAGGLGVSQRRPWGRFWGSRSFSRELRARALGRTGKKASCARERLCTLPYDANTRRPQRWERDHWKRARRPSSHQRPWHLEEREKSPPPRRAGKGPAGASTSSGRVRTSSCPFRAAHENTKTPPPGNGRRRPIGRQTSRPRLGGHCRRRRRGGGFVVCLWSRPTRATVSSSQAGRGPAPVPGPGCRASVVRNRSDALERRRRPVRADAGEAGG